ncbi:MAG: multidrug efflux RND transporter permease subunit [Planctomycetaceae bacterium]|nr:multidrug efflux RND transporter permease subunit [Planctomycetaceae bacterium]
MFSHFFIDRPIFSAVISIVIVLAGTIAVPLLPIEQTPDITPPTVTVTTSYPGASASVVAETVALPIESEVNGVEDMIYMSSKSTDDGTYELVVTFEVGTDIDMATVLVQNRVAVAMPSLPEEVTRQGVKTEKRSTAIVLMVNLISPNGEFSQLDLSNFIATNIKDDLSRLPGVGNVNVMGAKDLGMRIWLDPGKLKARNLTTNEVMQAIREQNVQVAAGQLGAEPAPAGQNFQYSISTKGRLSEPEEFEELILRVGQEGQLLRLGDIARVEEGAQSYRWDVELNNQPSVAVAIYQLPGANSLEVADAVRAKMEEIKTQFPPGMDYRIAYDTTTFVKTSIEEVVVTLLVAIALVVLTVYVFLQDLRTTLVPSITIPVSLIGTFAVMLAIGFSINTLTLFGLVLAIGIVVDDSIVVVENTVRLIDDEKLSAKEAAKKAMTEVSGPVVATTMVLLAVFVPTAFMAGITGRLYSQFSLTISVATIFSSINALTLAPALCGMLLRPSPQTRGVFFRLFNSGYEKTSRGYMSITRQLIRRSGLAFLLLLVATGLMIFGFAKVPGGFIPDEDQGYFLVSAKLPDGASMQRTAKTLEQIDDILENAAGVADIIKINGYSALDSLVTPNAGTYFVVMKPWDDREHIGKTVQEIQPKLQEIQEGLCFAFLPPAIQGLGAAGGFEMQLRDIGNMGGEQLQTLADELVLAGMENPRLNRMSSNFSASVPQVYLNVDRVKAKKLGIPLNEVFGTLQTNLGSSYVNDYNKYSRTWRVMAQADNQFRTKTEDIKQLQVRNQDGRMIPLSTLLTIDEVAGPQVIYRFNTVPSATITGQGVPGVSSGQAIQTIASIADQKLPDTMNYEWSGTAYQEVATGNTAAFIFALSVVLVYLFLCALYEAWFAPWAVIFTVPFAILGGIALTAMRGYDINVYTQIGIVLLIGLSTKTAILIVEFAKQLHEEGKSIQEAAEIAADLRFRAILMTAFSFILGVIPLVIASGAGAGSRRALGTAVFGGMSAATLFGVFVIPALYVVVQSVAEWRKKKETPSGAPESSDE